MNNAGYVKFGHGSAQHVRAGFRLGSHNDMNFGKGTSSRDTLRDSAKHSVRELPVNWWVQPSVIRTFSSRGNMSMGTGPSDSWWQSGFLFCGTRSALTRHRHNHITPVFTFIFCLQRYHTMKIITRGEAMRIHRQHPASRLFPFCTGKYRWHGSAETYTGREVQDIPGVLAVFAERRKDSFSPYVRLMSVTLN